MPKPDRWGCPICKQTNDIGQYTCPNCNYYRGVDKLRASPDEVRGSKTHIGGKVKTNK